VSCQLLTPVITPGPNKGLHDRQLALNRSHHHVEAALQLRDSGELSAQLALSLRELLVSGRQ
jgi:hypothetical protein